LDFIRTSQKCCASSLRLVIFDEDLPDAKTVVSQAKEILIENMSERECAFVALVDHNKMLLDGKHYSKNEMLDEAKKRGFSLLV